MVSIQVCCSHLAVLRDVDILIMEVFGKTTMGLGPVSLHQHNGRLGMELATVTKY